MVATHDNRKPKPVYFWNVKTWEYLGEGVAEPDPIDGSNWLIPSNATTSEPPKQKKGWITRWNEGRWVATQE